MNIVPRFVKFVLCTLFFWTFFPLLYLSLTPFYLLRLGLIYLQKKVHPEWPGVVNVRDAFLYEDLQNPRGLTHAIPGVMIVNYAPKDSKGIEDQSCAKRDHSREFLMDMRDYLGKILETRDKKGDKAYEKLTYYPETWLGFPFWKREMDFSLEKHIQFCPVFEGREVTQLEIDQFVAEHTHTPFAPKTAPWELLLFKMKNEGVDGGQSQGQRYGVLFRFHHMIADGLSILPLLGILDRDNLQAKLKTIKVPSSWSTKFWFLCKFLTFVGNDAVNMMLLDKDQNSWTIPEKQLTNRSHMISSEHLDYDLVRRASKIMGVSPTAVIFECFAGGIHNFLREQGQNQGGFYGQKKDNVTEAMKMGVAMPVPNHPLEGLVNHWTFATVDLPVSDPERRNRLLRIEQNLLRLARRATTGIVWLMVPFHAAVPYKILQLLTHNSMTTLLGSNFPGPRSKLRPFKDYEMESFRGFLPRLRGNSAVGLTSFTYNDKIAFSVCIDKGLMTERSSAQRLLDLIQKELVALAEGIM